MPKNRDLKQNQRKKNIHSAGAHGKVKLVPSGVSHPYTGVLKGADYGIIRFSSGTLPTADGKQPLVPAFGLKFMRDGVDSANQVAMYSVDGQQDDWNYFASNLSNHFPPARKDNTILLSAKFSEKTFFVPYNGMADMAQIG